jgi:hypothetical protein
VEVSVGPQVGVSTSMPGGNVPISGGVGGSTRVDVGAAVQNGLQKIRDAAQVCASTPGCR